MTGSPGNTWDHNFYMGTQNNVSTEKWQFQIFDWHLWIKDINENVLLWWPLTKCTCTFATIYTCIETSPNVCMGMPYICREPSYLHCKATSGYATMLYTVMDWFPDSFSFCLVCRLSLKNELIRGEFGNTWGHNPLYGHKECEAHGNCQQRD